MTEPMNDTAEIRTDATERWAVICKLIKMREDIESIWMDITRLHIGVTTASEVACVMDATKRRINAVIKNLKNDEEIPITLRF